MLEKNYDDFQIAAQFIVKIVLCYLITFSVSQVYFPGF